MRARQYVWTGTQLVVGVMFDPEQLGVVEARCRVLLSWKPGCCLLELPTGSWLLLLGSPQELRSLDLSGVAFVAKDGRFVASPDLKSTEGDLGWWEKGIEFHSSRADLTRLDPGTWIELGVPVVVLRALEGCKDAVTEVLPPPPSPDFRVAAKIGRQSASTSKIVSELGAAARVDQNKKRRLAGWKAGGRAASSSGRLQKGSDWLSKAVLRTPMRSHVNRKQQRYVEDLARQFQTGNFEDALRNAISLGTGLGRLTLRLPNRRSNLSYMTPSAGSSRSLGLEPTALDVLREMYLSAATELESAGRIDEAAFVLVELLKNVMLAIGLLERHSRYSTAATLSENNNLDPTQTARLWWLAGEHQRALGVARRHGVFQAVLDRVTAMDEASGSRFRLEWVNELERSGNASGAVEVGWVDPRIRPLLGNLIEQGIDLDDEKAAGLYVYRALLYPTGSNRQAVVGLLTESGTTRLSVRSLVLTMAQEKFEDPVVDRMLATFTLRALIRHDSLRSDVAVRKAEGLLRKRADRSFVADMVGPTHGSGSRSESSVELLPQALGLVGIVDAVPLAKGRMLLALGELGCRLVAADGRNLVHWDVPTFDLVPSDDGSSILLLRRLDHLVEVHHLSLLTRSVRRYGLIETERWASSFDGHTWAAVDARGLAFFDMLEDKPAISWRLLEPDWICRRIARTPERLQLLVTQPATPGVPQNTSVWSYVQPGLRLNGRRKIDPQEGVTDLHLLGDGSLIVEHTYGPSTATGGAATGIPHLAMDDQIRCSGLLLASQNASGCMTLRNLEDPKTTWTLELGALNWGMRSHSGRAAIWDDSGRAWNVALDARDLSTALRVVN